MLLFALFACPSPAPPPVAADYCEVSAEMFCGFYQRCERSAAPDAETCVARFLETCNGAYEPHYQALEAEGLLSLSEEGLAACAAHLATVPCEQQIFEIQGPCAGIWQGQQAAGGACGLGIDSFVCAAGSSCVLGLDFCGTCTPAAADGAACGDGLTCGHESRCVEGVCVARALPGDACSEAQPCLLGAWCEEGVCQAPTIVGEGASCDSRTRCAYDLACVDGRCEAQAFLGEACAEAGCASGWCEDGVCAPLKAGGAACGASAECVSGLCDGVCTELPGVCLQETGA